MDRDHYAILQVRRNATADEIERAYERLSAQFDPATSKKPKAAQRHAEVTAAYDALIDRERRRQYDRELSRRESIPGSISPSEALSNRFVVASALTVVASIVVVLAAILLLGGDGGSDGDPQVSATSTAADRESPSPAPDKPPELQGLPTTTDSGLQYIDIVIGTGAQPTDADSVEVWYTGWLQDGGTKFDSAVDNGTPATFKISEVVKGFGEGLKGMKQGGMRRLIIPPKLGYGEAGSPPKVPANATLIFDIELLTVIPAATPVPTPAGPTPSKAPDKLPELEGEPVTTASGLQYIDVVVGTGAQPTDLDSVEVWYTGWLQDGGTKFDSSVDRGTPSTFAISGVVKGFAEGLKGMKAGGQRRLIIPASLGYGASGQGTIPPNSVLIFDVELLRVITP